jgi:hypothetical protein
MITTTTMAGVGQGFVARPSSCQPRGKAAAVVGKVWRSLPGSKFPTTRTEISE